MITKQVLGTAQPNLWMQVYGRDEPNCLRGSLLEEFHTISKSKTDFEEKRTLNSIKNCTAQV